MRKSKVVEVLSAHIQLPRNQRCSCGWRGDASKGLFDANNIYVQHRNHVADFIVKEQDN